MYKSKRSGRARGRDLTVLLGGNEVRHSDLHELILKPNALMS
jgi:hypothetical protein